VASFTFQLLDLERALESDRKLSRFRVSGDPLEKGKVSEGFGIAGCCAVQRD
jgi:hypothetical protein